MSQGHANPQVRLATLQDVQVLVEVIQQSYRGKGGWTSEQELVSGERASADDLIYWLTDPHVAENEPIYVCETDGKVVGCIQPKRGDGNHAGDVPGVVLIPEQVQPLPSSPRVAILGLFGVHPAFQSKGIGRILMDTAFKHMREVWKCEKCIIWVLDARPDLITAYEKKGFTWKGETKPFVAPHRLLKPTCFRVMEKPL